MHKLVATAVALITLCLAPPAAAQQPAAEEEVQQPAAQDLQQAPAEVRQPPVDAPLPPAGGQQAPMATHQPAAAQAAMAAGQERPLMVLVGGSVTHDSNVFRLPQSADTQARTGRPTRSDRISSMYTGLRLDKPYAQQRFLLDLTVSAYRYDNFSFLDFNALQYRSAWQWHLTPRWSGVLSADREQALVSYADFRDLAQRNVRTMENRWLAVDGWLFEGWHLLAGLRQQEVRNSAPFVQLGSFRASGGDGGVRYVAGAGNSVDFRVRVLDGRYTDRTADPATLLDDGFSRVESEALATWIVTAKSTFDARIARVDYRATHFAQRDFSGTAARLGYRWAP